MKRRFFPALSLCLLLAACGQAQVEPPAPETPPAEVPPAQVLTPEVPPALVQLREAMASAGAMAGAAYLGPWSEELVLPEEYPFLSTAATVKHAGGQVFCIVPGRETDSLTVRTFSPSQTGQDQEAPGDLLYEGDGQPILLVCNLSDVMPNTVVTVTSADGRETAFAPALGMCDGTLALPADGTIYDFSSYGTTSGGESAPVFLGTWTAGDAALVFQTGNAMEFHREDSFLSGTFYVIDENAHYPPGSVVFEMGPAGAPFWGVFTLAPTGDTLTVTHLSGDPLIPGLAGETLTFTKE